MWALLEASIVIVDHLFWLKKVGYIYQQMYFLIDLKYLLGKPATKELLLMYASFSAYIADCLLNTMNLSTLLTGWDTDISFVVSQISGVTPCWKEIIGIPYFLQL